MSEIVGLALEVLDAIGRRDVEALIALADPEVEWDSLFAMGGEYRGPDGTRRYMRDLADAWEIGRAEVDDSLAVGEVAALVGRIHYRGKAGGVEGETPTLWILRFRDGKLLRFRAFRDPEQTLESLGAARP